MAEERLKFCVGLEIHARLKTREKIFCSCANRFGDDPNSNVCPVCLGLPGSLPVLNPEVLLPALRIALALECRIPTTCEFSRKNYFYPDLPRNYQITQNERPLALGGKLSTGYGEDSVTARLQRIHLEEDAGRSLGKGGEFWQVDMNRAGVPLVEIVTEPDFSQGNQARAWLGRLRQLLVHLDVCDGEMESGSLRCDANVGVAGDSDWAGPWVEIKNLNSFKAVGLAVDYEIRRLSRCFTDGQSLLRETRSWDSQGKKTQVLRVKESAAQYRFFPEPDLPLLRVEKAFLGEIAGTLPELPIPRERRFHQEFGVCPEDAIILGRSWELATYFQDGVAALVQITGDPAKRAGPFLAKWILSLVLEEVAGQDQRLAEIALKPGLLAQILALVSSGEATSIEARHLVSHILKNKKVLTQQEMVFFLARRKNKTDKPLAQLCREVLETHPGQVKSFAEGKTGLLNFFVGKVMAEGQGLFDAGRVKEHLIQLLK